MSISNGIGRYTLHDPVYAEQRLILSPSRSICLGNEFRWLRVKPAVYDEGTVAVRYHDIVLLP